jgi:LacI family transcriptional regulator
VPDEVAVVGVNDDKLLCGFSNPTLSSIDVNPEQIGYEAAALLDRLMAGAKSPEEMIQVAPRGLVVRQSSDVIGPGFTSMLLRGGVADPEIAAALRFMRRHAGEMISISQVANAVGISRSKLEFRFVKLVGRSPKQELLRIQLARAKELLIRSNLSITSIAREAGFRTPAHFCHFFRRHAGCPPGAYRRTHSVAKFTFGDQRVKYDVSPSCFGTTSKLRSRW